MKMMMIQEMLLQEEGTASAKSPRRGIFREEEGSAGWSKVNERELERVSRQTSEHDCKLVKGLKQ
jgi:hypothetical protein